MRHLVVDVIQWCDEDGGDSTEDPRDATCPECLRRAASYGAAAAMRYAAVEAHSKCPQCNPPLQLVP